LFVSFVFVGHALRRRRDLVPSPHPSHRRPSHSDLGLRSRPSSITFLIDSLISDLHRLHDYPAEAESLAADWAARIAAHGSLREARRVAQLSALAHLPSSSTGEPAPILTEPYGPPPRPFDLELILSGRILQGATELSDWFSSKGIPPPPDSPLPAIICFHVIPTFPPDSADQSETSCILEAIDHLLGLWSNRNSPTPEDLLYIRGLYKPTFSIQFDVFEQVILYGVRQAVRSPLGDETSCISDVIDYLLVWWSNRNSSTPEDLLYIRGLDKPTFSIPFDVFEKVILYGVRQAVRYPLGDEATTVL
jgi:hypothetical protein